MAYLVRKLNKRENVTKMCSSTDIDSILADGPVGEFRTKNGTLSTWKIDSLEDIENAVLAIAVTSSKLTRMDFIIINTDILDSRGLKYENTYAGQDIAVPDLQDSHYDIVEVTLKKLYDCSFVYRIIQSDDNDDGKFIVRYAEREIKDLLKKAYSENRIDLEILSDSIKQALPL